jgi:FKBP-type peptidyl-prolyl cis-trans isomerase FklB
MMSRSIGALSLALSFALTPAAQARQQVQPPAPQQPQPLATEKDKRSYALGMDLGGQLRKLAVDVDPSVFARGLADGLAGGGTQMTVEEAARAIARLQAEVKSRQVTPTTDSEAAKAEINRRAGQSFLATNAKREGVVTLPSGLQYKVVTAGTGRKPGPDDTVVCQYRGTLLDGTEFDSSYARGQPAAFPVSGVIAGWTEALQMMPVGSKWQVFVPGALAYGERGAGDKIGPNSTLIFEIELVSIK